MIDALSAPALAEARQVPERIFTAARATYASVWQPMRDKLEALVPDREVEFYAAVQRLRNPTGPVPPGIDRSAAAHVVEQAIAMTERVLGGQGGFA